jgi:hypothetical protein
VHAAAPRSHPDPIDAAEAVQGLRIGAFDAEQRANRAARIHECASASASLAPMKRIGSNILAVAGMLACCAGSASAQWNGFVFFGDSATDAGTHANQVPAGLGRFTTNPDPVWAQVLGARVWVCHHARQVRACAPRQAWNPCWPPRPEQSQSQNAKISRLVRRPPGSVIVAVVPVWNSIATAPSLPAMVGARYVQVMHCPLRYLSSVPV